MTDMQDILFRTIGSPFTDARYKPSPEEVDDCFDIAFENRVGLFFLERCVEQQVQFTERAEQNHQRLLQRREMTDDVMVRLSKKLQEKAPDRWVLFKSIKPFPSTPNDTDWFPFDISEHANLVEHLLQSGFSLLETAPLQTTLIEERGIDVTHSDKRGGVFYIDCYKAPGADYFIYLDPAKMRKHFCYHEINGHQLPALSAIGELIANMFHNVFPEKTYSIESFFYILYSLSEVVEQGKFDDFVEAIRENKVERAVSANMALTASLYRKYYGDCPEFLERILSIFPVAIGESNHLETADYELPYDFSNHNFWLCFFDKLRDPVSLRSAFVQALHMLNPFFMADVIRIIWRRTRKGGIYKQM